LFPDHHSGEALDPTVFLKKDAAVTIDHDVRDSISHLQRMCSREPPWRLI